MKKKLFIPFLLTVLTLCLEAGALVPQRNVNRPPDAERGGRAVRYPHPRHDQDSIYTH